MVSKRDFTSSKTERISFNHTGTVARITRTQTIQNRYCSFFIQHTSASLTINENADPTVRSDFESFFNRCVKEHEAYYLHTYEGSDDMPAHLKSSLLGQSVSVPIYQGELNLGTWQGIYLGEHRNHGGRRRIVVTLQGECY
ncbi:secondary thiamine-phosphate synthase enzyme YjbQ [Proteus mirabilis]|uniref:secondary thiamine-phosphate synthase enzyme YjbQ n=1 Tax=Proteus mirabilis TaxID=584 RepID=UPI0023494D3A|nr:secondary thiamine-phosphate synthase enzyme YjbQ [Proteus mirabilis]MDC5894230.1 secondary thiamine-phosphate synthase enzyme YjbQ [Proteus mirabilis]MDC5915362.1 secondary thiamine-phosphate synthase enzyme YjbQ [Proteus mirabilis]MDC5925879.1 secondary thiamine-phosphate synthase enzyme YjbQ [Proteus mirabilis]MDC6010865.1 secondary thiamine-phosphate synthase enzyme YjbQ [Proteus mirabilis]MDC6021438.1 secondary thiamine-phosphate synthase enzyme YjbQ [Proteus mirabilis]